MATAAEIESFRSLVQTHPHIDGHAHHLLKVDVAEELSTLIFENGAPPLVSDFGLAGWRSLNQVTELYGEDSRDLDPKALDALHKTLIRQDYEGLIRKCLEGTHALILDSSLPLGSEADIEDLEPCHWHDQFTKSPNLRALRIETIAESLIVDIMGEERVANESVWALFRRRFQEALHNAMHDTSVVTFTTDICSRTGLDIDPHTAGDDILTASLYRVLDSGTRKSGYHIEDKNLNDWLVQQTLDIRGGKPLQFHRGWPKNKANPPHSLPVPQQSPVLLEPLIANYSHGPKIVLNLAYCYARETARMASCYENVYLDLGEVFPRVSRHGQENFLRECFEVAPSDKMLWSSHGIWQPESFWLANQQFRQALATVLVDSIKCGDLPLSVAEHDAVDILFNNPNQVYCLGLKEEAL